MATAMSATARGAVVEVSNLRKSYGGRTVVDDVSFTVDEGEIFGILGPNGAGKTTTVECVEGLRVPDAGRVRVAGLVSGTLLADGPTGVFRGPGSLHDVPPW